jgi:formylmethanofuran dehydrogenase subunit E
MKSTRLNKSLLKSATTFHGHLGPYLVLGLRMGLLAKETLKPHGLHDLSVTVWTKRSPPESCVLDGIQISSGCTLGRSSLRVVGASQIRARFRKENHSILVKPTEEAARLLRSISGRTAKNRLEEIAVTVGSMPSKALFTVERHAHS